MTTRRLALAGLVGPPLFAAIVVLVTGLEWDFLHDHGWSAAPFDSPDPPWPSTTALGGYGFLQILNFILLGVSALALAVALFRLLRRRIGPGLVSLTAVGAGLSAFRADYGMVNGGGPDTWNGTVHAAAFTLLIPAALLSMFVLAVQFRRDERWRSLSVPSLITGLAALGSVVANLAGAGTLFFVIFLLTLVGWLMSVAGRAFSLSRRLGSAT